MLSADNKSLRVILYFFYSESEKTPDMYHNCPDKVVLV